MSFLNTEKTINLEPGVDLVMKQVKGELGFELKRVIISALLQYGIPWNTVLSTIHNLLKINDIQAFLKKDLSEHVELVDTTFKMFAILDTNKEFEKKIFEVLKQTKMVKFTEVETKDGGTHRTIIEEKEFSLEVMQSEGLVGHYYTILFEILKLNFLVFILTPIMRFKRQ